MKDYSTIKSGTLVRVKDSLLPENNFFALWLRVGENFGILSSEGQFDWWEKKSSTELEPICITYVVWEEFKDESTVRTQWEQGVFKRAFLCICE